MHTHFWCFRCCAIVPQADYRPHMVEAHDGRSDCVGFMNTRVAHRMIDGASYADASLAEAKAETRVTAAMERNRLEVQEALADVPLAPGEYGRLTGDAAHRAWDDYLEDEAEQAVCTLAPNADLPALEAELGRTYCHQHDIFGCWVCEDRKVTPKGIWAYPPPKRRAIPDRPGF